MKSIKVVIEHLDNILNEAEDYFADYVVYKDDAPKYAYAAYDMSLLLLDFFDKWQSVVISLINDETPSNIKMLDYEKERLNKKYNLLQNEIMNK